MKNGIKYKRFEILTLISVKLEGILITMTSVLMKKILFPKRYVIVVNINIAIIKNCLE